MKTYLRATLALAALGGLLVACDGDPGGEVPESWYPSKYGMSDDIGAANNLSREKVKGAASLVAEGKVYSLAVVTGPSTPAFGDRTYRMEVWEIDVGGPTATTYYEDRLETHVGIGTQIDGLGHVGIDHQYYNGTSAAEICTPESPETRCGPGGTEVLGIEKVPPIVTRGVLLDMTEHFGVSMLPAGKGFGKDDVLGAAKAQGVTIEKGDVVLFHTGWLGLSDSDPERFKAGEPGLTVDGAQALADLGVVALGADTWALEVVNEDGSPPPGSGAFEVHQTLLAKNGVYILENVHTAELAKDKVHEFLFVLGQPRIKGGIQAIVHPVAIR